jgi:hypothetical protein
MRRVLNHLSRAVLSTLGAALLVALSGSPRAVAEPDFPVEPTLFIDRFDASEGISFNAEGRLFIAANRAVWEALPDGSVTRLTDLHTNLGQAGYGERDILQADFGPTNVFNEGQTAAIDGIVWRVTPEGEKSIAATGIRDPNFVLVRGDGSYLVSDDGTDEIYLVENGEVSVWTDSIPFPNGMVLSLDGSVLYVAQIFSQLEPTIELTDRIWALRVEEGRPAGEPWLVAETGGKGVDGLAMDEHGRVYIADNNVGKIVRLDPETGEMVVIAEGMPHVASLVFGEGDFDHESIYATSTFRGGGKIWRVRVGVRGAPVQR